MRWILIVAALLLIGGCASTPRGVDARVDAPDSWVLNGRLALSNGRDGGSGELHWEHQGTVDQLRFHGALGRGSWRLTAAPGHAVLALGDGRVFEGPDVEWLVAEQTGWVIPVDALVYWVVAESEPSTPAQTRRDSEGRLELLIQQGWTIQYQGWYEVGGRWLPRKITADKDNDRVRLLVREWSLEPPATAGNPPVVPLWERGRS